MKFNVLCVHSFYIIYPTGNLPIDLERYPYPVRLLLIIRKYLVARKREPNGTIDS
jgi:hypothetical protein